MNNKEFIAELSRKNGYTQAQTQKMVKTLVSAMGASFEEGDSVSIQNFGVFDVKKRLERILKNPSTGQRQLVPPKLVLQFRSATLMKQILKGGSTDNG